MKPDFSAINIDDYTYPLTEDRIAKFPLEQRDASKLLVYDGHTTCSGQFRNIPSYLPENSFLVLNNTRVVRARLFFRKPTGALIEVFCLEPVLPTPEIQQAFQVRSHAVWKCLVGNARRWKEGPLQVRFSHQEQEVVLTAEKLEKSGDAWLLQFSWQPADLAFAEVLESYGRIPLPPYLNREAVEEDKQRYQTVYAFHDGSVAAPTAGLHFTEKVFEKLEQKNIHVGYITLHVGAGTFKPVGGEGIEKHEMHTEQVLIEKELVEKLQENAGKVIAVGTTTVRTLESLYWYGVKLQDDPDAGFSVHQFDPYLIPQDEQPDMKESLANVLAYMQRKNLGYLPGTTQLMIVPGYRYRMIRGMVTNFHQPRSTLLLLIAAWLGDKWKDIYVYALKNDFRFLSYGDSCLFL
ncbi:MAG: S-adenosylmethionine:tRNA ribosyltransferase-isomerase [Bacteroidales bacterium]